MHVLVRAKSLATSLSACVALMLLVNVTSASAATDVQGTADDLRVSTQNATIVEILTALSTRFKLTYTMRSQDSRALTASYSGTLRETLTRVLDGSDYILVSSDNGLEIQVLGASTTAGPQRLASSQVTTAPAISRPAGPANPNPSPSIPSPPPLSNYLSQNTP